MHRFWIGVVHRDHVRRGVQEGFVQLSHGKLEPLERMRPDDWLIHYSPKTEKGGTSVMAFTALGRILDRAPYPGDMGLIAGAIPMRRDVNFLDVQDAPIRPLLDELDLTRGQKNWGMKMRAGLLEITLGDFQTIAEALQATLPES
jgi:hypothetical protein